MNYFLKKDDFKDKTIFWDIDGTLAPYRFNGYLTCGVTPKFLNDISNGVFLNRPPSKIMQRILAEIEPNKNIIIGHYVNGRETNDKKKWVKKYFPQITETIFVPLPESKADIILNYCQIKEIDLKDCLFIDDSIGILYDAQEKGIPAWHISSLMDYFDDEMFNM